MMFDEDLQAAVARFQARHSVAFSIPGPKTIMASWAGTPLTG
jgi:hypothetical protein